MKVRIERKSVQAVARGILGGLCGAAATLPMTIVMRGMHRKLPLAERYPLPPRLITMNVAKRVGVESSLDEHARQTATVAAHYGYGAAAGAIYSACQGNGSNPIARGVVFGLFVWTVSYLGILPASGLFRTATKQPMRRNALMIAAHVVWGAALGALFHRASSARRADGI